MEERHTLSAEVPTEACASGKSQVQPGEDFYQSTCYPASRLRIPLIGSAVKPQIPSRLQITVNAILFILAINDLPRVFARPLLGLNYADLIESDDS
jgi:hypothetical protein